MERKDSIVRKRNENFPLADMKLKCKVGYQPDILIRYLACFHSFFQMFMMMMKLTG